ncbi:MAG: DUF5320 domain-containing protein [Dehalococcoidia bacterium]|nr:DUF5320 domain-containing protein [Dehalococcoidia bacterium]
MPGGDRTGPMGMGPMTGRGAGYCSGSGAPGYANAGFGWGRGFGRGLGRGYGWRAFQGPGPYYGMPPRTAPAGQWGAWQISRDEELSYLKGQADMLKQELDAIGDRIGQIEGDQSSGGTEEE